MSKKGKAQLDKVRSVVVSERRTIAYVAGGVAVAAIAVAAIIVRRRRTMKPE